MSLSVAPSEPRVQPPVAGRGPALLAAVLTLIGITVLAVWRTGPDKVPNIVGFEGIARFWPLYPLEPIQAYVLRQALGQALYRALGWAGTGHYLALHLLALAVAAAGLGVWLLRRLGTQRGTVAMSLLLLSPVSAVLLEWIGMYDAFSLLVWVLLLVGLRGNALVQGAVGILGGLQNFEQFAVSVALLLLLPEAARKFQLRAHPVALLAGATVGKLALELYLRSAGAVQGTRASFLADGDMQYLMLSTFASLAPVILWSALGGLWIPVLHRLPQFWSTATLSLRYRAAAAAALVIGIGVVATDHTRVMVLVSFPLTVLLAMRLAMHEETVTGWLRRPETWLVLLAPPVIVGSSTILPLGLDLTVWL